MSFDNESSENLTTIIAQVRELISTTTPLPENRTPRCLQLLNTAEKLAQRTRGSGPSGKPQPKMDAAAARARPELEQNHATWTVRQLAAWWHRWHLDAGHKRLGRMLLDVSGPKSGVPFPNFKF
jgi:hypothetical protein